MCNEAARRLALGQIRDDFDDLRIPLRFPEGIPNLADAPSVRITDRTPILRQGADGIELVQRRWSWPGTNGRPLYNYRSEGRTFTNTSLGGRCLIPLDAFYEFTASPPGQKRKRKWAFTLAAIGDYGRTFFCVAGAWRRDPSVGEAFTMLTCEPGPDIAPYHARQIVLLRRRDWLAWMDGTKPATALLHPTPAGTLVANPAEPTPPPRACNPDDERE